MTVHIRLAYRASTGFHSGVKYAAQPNSIQDIGYEIEFKVPNGAEFNQYVTTLYFASRKCKNAATEVIMRDHPTARAVSVTLKN